MDNCASYSPHATHTLLPPFSQCISLRCSVRSNLCTSLLPVTYHVCLRGSSRTENACARTDTFTIVFSHSLEEFDFEVEGWLPLLPEVSLPCLTGQMLADVVSTFECPLPVVLMVGVGGSLKSCLFPGMMG